jgi:hypothetical protein
MNKYDELEKLAQLKASGILSEEEYNQQKATILANSTQPHVIVTKPKSDKNKWIALLFCYFMGFLGVHRFYVGKTGTGILYLFTLGLFGIGILVDFFVILFGNFRDAQGRYLSD